MVKHIKKFAHIFGNILHIYLTLRILSVLECHALVHDRMTLAVYIISALIIPQFNQIALLHYN